MSKPSTCVLMIFNEKWLFDNCQIKSMFDLFNQPFIIKGVTHTFLGILLTLRFAHHPIVPRNRVENYHAMVVIVLRWACASYWAKYLLNMIFVTVKIYGIYCPFCQYEFVFGLHPECTYMNLSRVLCIIWTWVGSSTTLLFSLIWGWSSLRS